MTVLAALFTTLFGTVAEAGDGFGGSGILWTVLIILAIICLIVWLVRRG